MRSPPTLANRELSPVTATSSTEYPCASYRWIGLADSAGNSLLALFGTARDKWIDRSDDPVSR